MRIAIIADTFPPLRTSGAVQLRDLSIEFAKAGHETTMLVADPAIAMRHVVENYHGVTVVRLKTPRSKDINYARRIMAELVMPFAMIRNFKASSMAYRKFDAIIWYSPSIFLSPIVRWLKKRNNCPSYLILRDIFPHWAVDMGVITHGPVFQLLKAIANYQFRSADFIGVQTSGNLAFFDDAPEKGITAHLEVLHNWLADEPDRGCNINLDQSVLAGRRIFVYAGNMGIAQDMDKLVRLAGKVRHCKNIGFLFVGRGSEVKRLRDAAQKLALDNIMFEDEIEPPAIPGLYRQCSVGLICLDSRHKTHNIPGKFISYMRAGLPVLASINPGNDLIAMIEKNQVGRTSSEPDGSDLAGLALQLLNDASATEFSSRCRELAARKFDSRTAVNQIVCAIANANKTQKLDDGKTE